MKDKQTAVIYARVSTNDQSYQRQLAELEKYAAANDFNLLAVFEEKITGLHKGSERPELNKLMQLVKANKINHVLVTELSRFGRGTADTLTLIEQLTANCCCLHIKDLNNLRSLTADCKIDPMAEMFLTMLAGINKMELDILKKRMKSGYDNHRANGGTVGRLPGYKKPIEQIKHFADIKRKLNAGNSIRNIKAILAAENKNISLSTIVKVKSYLNIPA
jgi:DNA invertase Pin-like site-specific DNA recombinase